ncbi:Transmembrane protein 56-B [Carex littledalei]|uniref:Transmembrane protein 56-B n=1 Tax=Carex littledalei TaxID=544730 RepID=A0A833VFW2_9POAL|nr:Transmembrane protein 56-B [Carex littledalei]
MDQDFGPTEQFLLPLSVVSGILMSKANFLKFLFHITSKVSSQLYKGYDGLRNNDRVEWNNRSFSTFHSLMVTVVSFHLVFLSDIFKEDPHNPIILLERKSQLSVSLQGVSLGYFITDFAMIIWFFPSLGGMEYVLHHLLAIFSISLTLTSGKGHVYVHTLLLTEATTPFVNLRWYLVLTGKKSSTLYLYNGLAMFSVWLVRDR